MKLLKISVLLEESTELLSIAGMNLVSRSLLSSLGGLVLFKELILLFSISSCLKEFVGFM